jgi:septal ring factor EnvC (AmiA/AmiB activator)
MENIMFLSIISFFSSFGGKALSILLLLGVLTTAYFTWENHIKNLALEQFNKAQIEQTAKDNAEFKAKLKEVDDVQKSLINQTNLKNQELQKTVDDLNNKIDTNTAKIESLSSDVLKNTIKDLENLK